MRMNRTIFERRVHLTRGIRGAGACAVVLSLLLVACDGGPEQATGAGAESQTTAAPNVVHLTADEIQKSGVTAEPVTRTEFRVARVFPGTVVPNQHALADITTLVRGRVVDVYADLGKQVKGGD